ncbi:MAG: endonuclease/exonuclease/phosphatase family protein [Gammaproteobacteria bacterium]|nr:endonuclease/exonuclease/phosphatase family protein [Gammaproteobacteria bacterium]
MRNLCSLIVLPSAFLVLASCATIPTGEVLISGYGSEETERHASCLSVTQDELGIVEAVPGELDPGAIDLLVWNIYKGNIDGWLKDLDHLSLNRDLVILQEVKLDRRMQEMLAESGYHWRLATAFHYRDLKTGVLTASSAAPVFSCMYRVQEPLIRIPKSVLVTRYALANHEQQLLAVNIHGINFESNHKGFKTQLTSLGHIVNEHIGPVIVAGDFNTWSQARVDHLYKLVDKVGLKPLAIEGENRTQVFGHNLDLIFYRGLVPVEAGTMAVVTSDHTPLAARFVLEKSE